ncbi:unnamed protein product [Arabis nemorensis]|uniref:Uncharacterized protein n=1 Tax=Arabis nemorensis TaxID=586526 RepID=A0A565BJ99_9BRAS|nr:unnamed protein product [Arabis nemorensis]
MLEVLRKKVEEHDKQNASITDKQKNLATVSLGRLRRPTENPRSITFVVPLSLRSPDRTRTKENPATGRNTENAKGEELTAANQAHAEQQKVQELIEEEENDLWAQ